MTWSNTAARVLMVVVVLPLVLRRFTPGDVALYLLFLSVMSLQMLSAGGFLPTFARFVSYVLAGARLEDLERARLGGRFVVAERGVDSQMLGAMVGTLRHVFVRLTFMSTPVVAILGTVALRRPIDAASDQGMAWFAWSVVLVGTTAALFASHYSAFLQGANRIALEQRWAAIFSLAGAITAVATVLAGGDLFALVAVNQFWQIAAFFRLRWLARSTLRQIETDFTTAFYSRDVFRCIWPSSWRSLLGVAGSAGVTALAGLGFAQVVSGRPLAEFLLGLRVMAVVSEVSRAPFYSKLPLLNVFRARDAISDIIAVARHGMQRAFVVYLTLVAAVPVVADSVLARIDSTVSFPSAAFWSVLSIGMFLERYGAMHLQLYSTTNVIVWHWLNGFTGLTWIALMIILAPLVGTYAYPASMVLAYGFLYVPVAVTRSLRSLATRFVDYESRALIPAAIALVAICAGLLVLDRA